MEATIAGVILGFVLGFVADLIRSSLATKLQNESTRTLIQCEIESNKEMLAEYWSTLMAASDSWWTGEGKPDYFHLAHMMIRFTLPPLSKQAWIASFDKIPAAYCKDQIKGLWEIHRAFEHLKSLHDRIMLEAHDAESLWRAREASGRNIATIAPFLAAQEFGNEAAHLANSFEEGVRTILGDQFTEFPR